MEESNRQQKKLKEKKAQVYRKEKNGKKDNQFQEVKKANQDTLKK